MKVNYLGILTIVVGIGFIISLLLLLDAQKGEPYNVVYGALTLVFLVVFILFSFINLRNVLSKSDV